jgi:hypothetical protein
MARQLGVSASTVMGDAAALNLWTAFRNEMQSPIDVTPDQLKESGAEDLIEQICKWASTRVIPYNFDKNLLRPPNSTCKRVLTSVTLVKYVGKIIKYFRTVDPNHVDWKDLPKKQEAVPKWWTEMIPRFRLEATRFALQHQGEEVFGVNEIKPLYPDLGLDDNNGREPLRICDQKHVFIKLVKNADSHNDNLQMLAAIHATAEAIGRGGEAKSQTSETGYLITSTM